MQSKLNPYLEFDGNAREAMEFYRSVFGGNLTVSTYKDFNSSSDPSQDNKIMHAQLLADNGITLMGADSPQGVQGKPDSSISITLSGDNYEELKSYYEKLLEGGTVLEPLETAPWGDSFGMLVDRYGFKWMVNISRAGTA